MGGLQGLFHLGVAEGLLMAFASGLSGAWNCIWLSSSSFNLYPLIAMHNHENGNVPGFAYHMVRHLKRLSRWSLTQTQA